MFDNRYSYVTPFLFPREHHLFFLCVSLASSPAPSLSQLRSTIGSHSGHFTSHPPCHGARLHSYREKSSAFLSLVNSCRIVHTLGVGYRTIMEVDTISIEQKKTTNTYGIPGISSRYVHAISIFVYTSRLSLSIIYQHQQHGDVREGIEGETRSMFRYIETSIFRCIENFDTISNTTPVAYTSIQKCKDRSWCRYFLHSTVLAWSGENGGR